MRIVIFVFLVCSYSNVYAKQSTLEEIKVTAHPLGDGDLAQDVKVLTGEQLSERLEGSLGETIAGEVGIRSASFGSAVGRPVIHGLGGPRIKTTEDRIDSLDVSVTSTDHAVTIEPFIANRINILKGSSTLLYGTGAIGGVVDVETGRIAKELPAQVGGRLEVRVTDNANASVAAARLDGSINQLAWHIDAFDRDADDYEIPGFAESELLRSLEAESGDTDEEESRGILFGSRAKNRGGAGGLSYHFDQGFVGASVSVLDAQYGLVGGHHEEGEEEDAFAELLEGDIDDALAGEEVPGIIDLEQTRIDFEMQRNLASNWLNGINIRFAINDYQHKEIEESGEIGTVFENDAWEGRVELSHQPLAEFTGTFGLQANSRDFSAIGEEAFIPEVESSGLGLFWLGEREFAGLELEMGARVERVTHDPVAAGNDKVEFTSESLSFGALKSFTTGFSVAALFDYASRAPSIEELFSNGAHLATQSFEIGDSGLQEESSRSLTLTLQYDNRFVSARASAYLVDFSDFIYQDNRGDFREGFPVFVYRQNDARFSGLDIESEFHLASVLGGDVDLFLQADLVDAKVESATGERIGLPRIPAQRRALGLQWQDENWRSKLELTRVSAQDDVGLSELSTSGYTDISLYLARTAKFDDKELTVFFHGKNLGDSEQRNHTSFIKDFAPAPGRRLELGVRFNF